MGATVDALKALVVPAVIALILFIVTSYVLLPLWRHYQLRYSQYIPVHTISDRTSSARTRMQAFMGRWLVPSNWRRTRVERGGNGDDDDEDGLSEDLDFLSANGGEELGRVYAGPDSIRDSRHALSLDAQYANRMDSTSRLSRDLEQGFRDDSEEEESDPRQRR
ncbi:hypothetical protein Micbo1qcDRAFT_54453 [Microdochium bolleyi]|uniref:Uncharacterized protein n=1 Tax=Microdochium bolleyi TaxID=196109 RepID=A0A136J7X7_9PEZI|nr:hypothetical protein Micbo1qcDRAFT_54453 [Microdochium bolleyi]